MGGFVMQLECRNFGVFGIYPNNTEHLASNPSTYGAMQKGDGTQHRSFGEDRFCCGDIRWRCGAWLLV